MKQLKDYLHLYLGCECELTRDEYTFPHSVPLGTYELSQYLKGKVSVKPILRPLNDITLEESISYYKTVHPNHIIQLESSVYSVGYQEVVESVRLLFQLDNFTASGFLFLLSKHFDLFGLIDAGLALDATKMPNKEPNDERCVTSKVK